MSDQDKLAEMMEKLLGGKPPEEKPTPKQEAGWKGNPWVWCCEFKRVEQV